MNKNFSILRIISLIIFIFFIALLIYSLVNYKIFNKQINEKIEYFIDKYGFISVFITAFLLEISPQPFVSGLAPMASGLVFGMDYNILLIVVCSAVILSSLFAYFLGLIYGEKIALEFLDIKTYKKYIKLFKKYGNAMMSIIAFTPLPYFPVLAGVFKMKIADFVVYALFFRILYYFISSWLFFIFLV